MAQSPEADSLEMQTFSPVNVPSGKTVAITCFFFAHRPSCSDHNMAEVRESFGGFGSATGMEGKFSRAALYHWPMESPVQVGLVEGKSKHG